MATIRPKPLPRDAVLRVLTPSSPVDDKRDIRRCVRALRARGFRPQLGEHVGDELGYLAGPAADRVADLHAAFADPDVDGVIALRGGYGAAELVPLIDYDLVRAHPKPFVGMSDVTVLHLALGLHADLVTFFGPLGIQLVGASDYTWRSFDAALIEPAVERTTEGAARTICPGTAEGELVGGTTTLVSCSIGTSWEIDTAGKIVLLEDVHEEPYRIDRMLLHLLQAGKLADARGIVFGTHADTNPRGGEPSFGGHTLPLEDVLERLIRPLGVPAVAGLPLGHAPDMATVPLGARCRLDAGAGRLTVLGAEARASSR